ncbi:MAG TPA: class I SAM-dependent methyltransferase [Steroidobacteraceae bacterium]|nr:class I SAM-dependent methyltransferase [Steroidobacteraceae bacterium]
MDPSIERLLAEYDQRSDDERQARIDLATPGGAARRDQLLLAVGRGTGTLLNLLVKSLKARSILELGTSYGYSAVWLAEAARETGGKVITTDLVAEKSAYAKQRLGAVGLAQYVDFRVGDVLDILRQLAGPFDFVLLDVWKDLYIPCFDLFAPKLAPGAIVVADNMIEPESARVHAEAYRKRVRESGAFDSVLLPIGSGIEVSRRREAGGSVNRAGGS